MGYHFIGCILYKIDSFSLSLSVVYNAFVTVPLHPISIYLPLSLPFPLSFYRFLPSIDYTKSCAANVRVDIMRIDFFVFYF